MPLKSSQELRVVLGLYRELLELPITGMKVGLFTLVLNQVVQLSQLQTSEVKTSEP